jgi:tetratricopeptide (TPR) repeat protein
MAMPDGLYVYEFAMLLLGIAFFVVLLVAFVYQFMHKKSNKGLLPFFALSIVMMGYPSIRSVQYKDGILTVEKTTHELEKDPTNAALRNQLEQKITEVATRPAASDSAAVTLAKAQYTLGHEEAAAREVRRALQLDPRSTEAIKLQQQMQTVQKIDHLASHLNQNPGDRAARAELERNLAAVTARPVASPEILAKVARAQAALGQREQAQANVDKAVKINPNSALANTVRAEIQKQ